MKSSSHSKNPDATSIAPLQVETLESRMMLSSVQIFAAGATGTESLELKVNDVVAATFDNVGGDVDGRQFETLKFNTDQTLTADDIRLEFVNDLYRAEDGFDRNVLIDRIVIDGVVFETESDKTYSTGLWRDGGIVGPGFLETELLNVNGSFFYSSDGGIEPPSQTGTRLRIEANGTTGEEQLRVRVDGNVVETFDVTTQLDSYFWVSDDNIDVGRIQLEFANDLYDPANGIDRNLIVEQIQLIDRTNGDRQRFFTNSDTTFSTGTWREADGVIEGFGRGDTLHSNGYFSYGEDGPTGGEGSLIRFTAAGDTGEEIVQLLIDGNVFYETEVPVQFSNRVGSRGFYEYQVITDQKVDLSQLRLAFVNDGTTDSGRDRNLSVDYIYVKDLDTGNVQRTTASDSSTFSTGTYLPEDGVVPGFGRGNKLFTDGYFEFTESSRLVVFAFGDTGEERFQVLVNGQVEAEFLASEPSADPFEGRQFFVDFDGPVNIEDIRIDYINDGLTDSGEDKGLRFTGVRLDSRLYGVETTGTDGILNENGSLQYGSVPQVGASTTNTSARFPVLVNVQWLEANTFPSPFSDFVVKAEEDGEIRIKLNRIGGTDGPLSETYEITAIGDNSLPGSVTSQFVTIDFDDDQLASTLNIPVNDNNVADGGFFQLRKVGGTDASDFLNVEITDSD